jgi:hypothetical protein
MDPRVRGDDGFVAFPSSLNVARPKMKMPVAVWKERQGLASL